MATIRWGIIGCGDVTETKSGPGFQKAARSQLVAVMRRDGRKAADYAQRHGVPRWYDDADTLIADPDVDAVYVATPPDSHKAYALACAAAGKPVLVEKPLALTGQDADEMVAACQTAGVKMFTAFYRRAMPRFETIRDLIKTGRIGRPRIVVVEHRSPPPEPFDPGDIPWRFRPEVGGGGKFIDTAPHTFDLLDHFFGPVDAVTGTATNQAGLYPAEDTVAASFRFANGVTGSGTWCYVADRHHEQVRIIGTEGEISFGVLHPSPVVVSTPTLTETLELGFPDHVHQPLIQSVVDDLCGLGSCASTGSTGARTSHVMDRILADFRSR